MTKAARAAQDYRRMSDMDRCAVAGNLMRRTWYARVYQPDRVEALIAAGYPVAREQQIPAWIRETDSCRTHTFMGGRSSGKTRSASGWFAPELLERPGYRLAIMGPDFKISRDVGIKGMSGLKTIIEAIDPTLIDRFDEVKNVLHLVNGSRAFCFSTQQPQSIEGHEHHGFWGDEIAEWSGTDEAESCVYRKAMEPCIRLLGPNGEPIRKVITGTPEATPLIIDINSKTNKYPKLYAWTQLATRDNLDNVDRAMFEQMYEESDESSDFFKAKLEGHLLLESSGALVTEKDFSRVRVAPTEERHRDPEQCDVVTMAVDANHSEDKKSDECGILIGGSIGRHAYVFSDASIKGGPKAWGERIIEALIAFPEIDEICVEDDKSLVIEVVEGVLRDALREIGRPIRVKPMPHKNKSKKARADPVAVEYQLKHVLHCPSPRRPEWSLGKYEQQWKSWNPKTAKKSPDRVDAGVYLVTRLLLRDRTPDEFFSASEVAQWR